MTRASAARRHCFFDYRRQLNLDAKVLRIFNTYGPRMRPDDGRVVSNFIVQALQNKDITVYGDGYQTRSFCYVNDLVEGMVAMMDTQSDYSGPVNLGNPDEISILELAEKIKKYTGSRSKIAYRPLPQDDPGQRLPDITRAKKDLNWEPVIPLEEGLKPVIDYFEKRLQIGN